MKKLGLLLVSGVLLPASVFATGGPFTYNTVSPCRLVDTRRATGVPYVGPALSASQANARDFGVTINTPGATGTAPYCGVAATAQAVAMNVAVINPQQSGDLRIYPSQIPPSPLVSTLNFVAGDTIANGAIVPLDGSLAGAFTVWYEDAAHDATGTTNLIVDINGYFAP